MSDIIRIKKKNEVFVQIDCDPSIQNELSEFFTFFVPGHRFMPAFRNKLWDGKIRLFDSRQKTLYCGLISYLAEFAETRKCELEFLDDDYYGRPNTEVLVDEIQLAIHKTKSIFHT